MAGRFEVQREVGRGAAGVVYRAIDATTGGPVALKVIAEGGADPSEHTRFLQEGEVLTGLVHPGIVHVVAYGTLDGGYADGGGRRFPAGSGYVAMEWLEGEDLSARQRRAPLTLAEAVDVAGQVAEALAFAHAAGIVHRDIKPSNVFLVEAAGPKERKSGFSTLRGASTSSPPGALDAGSAGSSIDDGLPEASPPRLLAKLLDFGVAAAGDTSLAGAGAIVGTPAYMSPEQAQGDAAPDARSDLYSLGATLFELCAGRPPHAGPTSIATLARRVTGPAPRLSEVLLDVPERLDDLVARLLELSPSDRPASARDVAAALRELSSDPATLRAGRLTLREADTRARVGTRLVTTLVALGVATGEERRRLLERVRALGADALPLGADSIVAHLGARRAYGDEAPRALEIGQELADRGGKVGIATGRTRVDLTSSSGEIVDRAAKLARETKDGKVAFDLTTAELARGRLELDVPSLGQSGVLTTNARRVRSESESSTFVGREGELLSAVGAFDRCHNDRTPLVVSISGPPGIGKSRLGQELVLRLERRSDPPRVMFVRCESYGRGGAGGATRSGRCSRPVATTGPSTTCWPGSWRTSPSPRGSSPAPHATRSTSR